MSYGLIATAARTVNAVKHRALDQNVAVSLHNSAEWRGLTRCLDLPSVVLDGVGALLRLHLTCLLPLRDDRRYPDWVSPAVRAGQVCVFNGWWAPAAALWQLFPRLYGSSANLTGQPPATTVAQARCYFGPDAAVLDDETMVAAPRSPSASTVVRVDRRGRLGLHRSGAHDRAGPTDYLGQLARQVGLTRNRGGIVSQEQGAEGHLS